MPHETQTGIPSNKETRCSRACHCVIRKHMEPESPQRPAKSHLPRSQPQRDRSAVCVISSFRREADEKFAGRSGNSLPTVRNKPYRSHLQGSKMGTFIWDPAFRSSAWESHVFRHPLCQKHSVRFTIVAPVIVDVSEMYKNVWWCAHGTSLPLQLRPDN